MIFWQQIKGLNKSSNSDFWTYIEFTNNGSRPTIKLNDNSQGSIVCEDSNNNFAGTNTFAGGVTFKNQINLNTDSAMILSKNFTSNLNNHTLYIKNANTSIVTVESNSVTMNPKLSINNTGDSNVPSSASIYTAGGIYAAKSIKAAQKCEAQYFNATSDKRAKTNLHILDINALDIINKTQLYTFDYKDTNTPSIGILAQDLQDYSFNGFKLVDNENASGQDLDYMTIHESKLVYLLWKAIQEQQLEIDQLKQQLGK